MSMIDSICLTVFGIAFLLFLYKLMTHNPNDN